jgi:hypothetical protein
LGKTVDVWKASDPERRNAGTPIEVHERRHNQLDSWLAREHDRRVRDVREAHHDAHAKIIGPMAAAAGERSVAAIGK